MWRVGCGAGEEVAPSEVAVVDDGTAEGERPFALTLPLAPFSYRGADLRIETFATLLFDQWQVGHAKLGNHDWNQPNGPAAEILFTRESASWRMPAAYYTFTAGPVQFFALDPDVISGAQLLWLTAELERMRALVREAMQDGAFGLSTGLFYVPATFSKTDEIVELAKVAGQLGGIHISHVRDEELDVEASVRETIAIGELGGLPPVAGVGDPYEAPGGVAPDGRSLLASVYLDTANPEAMPVEDPEQLLADALRAQAVFAPSASPAPSASSACSGRSPASPSTSAFRRWSSAGAGRPG